ncbi:2-oxoacid:acceptor oxidoreductase family protein [Planctomycetota bacterium]
MAQEMTEIRWHGRGGQGAKTAAGLVAEVAMEEGKFSQGFPEYGPERMGAPIRGFTRISDGQILVHSPITKPDVVVVLDETLLDAVDVSDGVGEDGIVIVNTQNAPADIAAKLSAKNVKVWTVDATQIAIDELGRPIPNTPMIGALVKATAVVDMDGLKKSVKKKFMGKFGEAIVQGNLNAIDRAHSEAREG